MKVSIIGTGAVGRATAFALTQRASCEEILLVDKNSAVANSTALDISYGTLAGRPVRITSGSFDDIRGSRIVILALGVNEKAGGATDPNDPQGRLRLLGPNAPLIADVVPLVVRAAPDAILIVVTNPPEPLADLARLRAGHTRVMSSGTLIDTLRFRMHAADLFGMDARDVEGFVIGEHGTGSVLCWSTLRIAGDTLERAAAQHGIDVADARARIERDVRAANINIIEGIGASQYGIGAVAARLVEAVARDEGFVAPVGMLQPDGVTYCLPVRIGFAGAMQEVPLSLDDDERAGLDACVTRLAGIQQGLRREWT